MGRSCLIEEDHVASYVKGLIQTRVATEVGILIGRLGVGNRDFIFSLAKTPTAEGDAEDVPTTTGAKGKGKKTSAGATKSLAVDADWMGEHAQQVSRMLPGGIDVVGVYVVASEQNYKSSVVKLTEAIRAVAKSTNDDGQADADDKPLLLHIDPTNSRYSVRHVDIGAKGDGLNPTEYKFGQTMTMFHCLECVYPVDIQTITLEADSSLRSLLSNALLKEIARVRASEVLLDGSLLPEEDLVCNTPAMGAANSPGCVHVDLLTPFEGSNYRGDRLPANGKGQSYKGMCSIQGAVVARAYVHGRESCSRAAAMIKEDICVSLRARLALLSDEADRAEEDAEDAEAGEGAAGGAGGSGHPLAEGVAPPPKPIELKLPKRVLLPWLGQLHVGDYLMPEETPLDAIDRCVELLGLSDPRGADDVVLLETEGTTRGQLGPWKPLAGGKGAEGSRTGKGASSSGGGTTKQAGAGEPKHGGSNCFLYSALAGAGVVGALSVAMGQLMLGES
mmetsp:Transcript_18803/g.41150  ORF Transcript_18803/g.41150 Transcript_18803/m.41150 type:complete len:504 (-) Transcript_18803:99-1610(-)